MSDHEELLRQARKRFLEAEEAEAPNREQAAIDLRFLDGQQWDATVRTQRESSQRPALTINRLPTFVSQVINEARKNKPAIKISPRDSGPDKDTAEVMQGLCRHIEADSDAEVAYATAYEYAVQCGFGYFRVTTDYVATDSFDQEIKIVAVPDPFSVYFDPHAKVSDRSDANYAFVISNFSKDEFKLEWPNAECSTSDHLWESYRTASEGWITESTVRVAEYWYIEKKRRKLLLLPTGETVFADEAKLPPGVEAMKEREVIDRKVKCIFTNGVEVLEEFDHDGEWIPIIRVAGKELMVDERVKTKSVIRDARDPQQLYNYYKTAQAETVGTAPRTPFIGAEGQFDGHEEKWRTANVHNHAYLEYKPTSIAGQPVGAPQRQIYEPPINALSIGAAQASDDIKATTGIFDASLGARSNETSGVAIARRQAEADSANFHFLDNLRRAVRQCGRVVLGLIPSCYDTEREIRILGKDETQRIVRINSEYKDETGKVRHYKIGVGKYDVTATAGPSYTSQREETLAALTQFGQSWPKLFDIAGDILFRASDFPAADEVAERLKKALPPELTADKGDGAAADLPPEVQAKLQALQQQNQQLAEALDRATGEAAIKKAELESRERIAEMANETKLAIEAAKIDSQEGLELLRHEIAAIGARLDRQQQPQQPQQQQ